MRTAAIVIVLTLSVVGCRPEGPETGDQPPTTIAAAPTTTAAALPPPPTSLAPTTTTNTTTAPVALGAPLSYSYRPGDTHTFDLSLEQTLDMTSELIGAPAPDEQLPSEADLTSSIEGTVRYDVAAGPEPGTHRLTVTGDFDQVGVSGTVDGEPVEDQLPSDLDFAGIDPPDLTVVVDDRGNLVSAQVDGQDVPVADPLAAVGDLGSGNLLNGPLGPAFPADALDVGDEWTTEETTEAFDETVTVRTTHRVAALDELDGIPVARIESTSETTGFTLSLGEYFESLFAGFESGQDSSPGLQALLDQIEFTIESAPTTSSSVTWFDPARREVRRLTAEVSSSLVMTVRLPDPERGELTGFVMNLAIEGTYRLQRS